MAQTLPRSHIPPPPPTAAPQRVISRFACCFEFVVHACKNVDLIVFFNRNGNGGEELLEPKIGSVASPWLELLDCVKLAIHVTSGPKAGSIAQLSPSHQPHRQLKLKHASGAKVGWRNDVVGAHCARKLTLMGRHADVCRRCEPRPFAHRTVQEVFVGRDKSSRSLRTSRSTCGHPATSTGMERAARMRAIKELIAKKDKMGSRKLRG